MSVEYVVDVNGKKVAVKQGATVADALAAAGASHYPGTVIGIISGREEARKEVATEFRIMTTRGEVRLELSGALKHAWLDSYSQFTGTGTKWTTSHAIAFGPAPTGVTAGKTEAEYHRWDVAFGTGGYDAKNTYLIISKADHSSDYGVKGGGTFGKIISGKKVLDSLGQEDSIKSIEPVVKLEKFANKTITMDTSMPVEDGMEIHTALQVEMLPKAREGAEHFYAAVKDGMFPVDFCASTFISSDIMLGEVCPYENLGARSEGAVSIRTDGSGKGRIYISRADMTSSIYHSIVGRVINGIELVKIVSPGQRIAVTTMPDRLSVLGMDLKAAEAFLTQRGVTYEKAGHQGEDAVVVDQTPRTTMEIVSSGTVKITSIPRENLVEIKLYDNVAPQSVEYFRRATGLKEQHVGALNVFFKYEDTLLFKGKTVHVGELIPENKPDEGMTVAAGEIGLTNMAAKYAGMVGVRFGDSSKFGPTGEKYVATNIIGRVLNMEKLRKTKDKETVYFTEVR
ncbi:methyl-coenzyme M reductase-associated protein Mmp3 [Methanocella sp. MCL-LM]|uniref:methyl-coenzyme M reductase-associated protein Mmp3 n=1 Tax=Methanocella sp. MCL-LM TaxID=3412035 RepID=UPI003C763BF9